jgi:hypothetical protein
VVVGSGLIFGMGRSNRGCGVQLAVCVVRSISCLRVAEILEMTSGTGIHGILVSSTSYLLTSHMLTSVWFVSNRFIMFLIRKRFNYCNI